MSWQSYVDTNLVGSGKVSKAAIIGLQGGVWAASAGYVISVEEQNALITGVNNLEATQGTGIRLAGQKFFTVRITDRSIYGKKQADGVVVVKTDKAILVAEYLAPLQAAETTPVVEGLADYLIGAGF